jgi:hypothetical protein
MKEVESKEQSQFRAREALRDYYNELSKRKQLVQSCLAGAHHAYPMMGNVQ